MTSIAAEGMFGDLDENGFIVDRPDAFAERAIDLYSNSEIWHMKQQNGFTILNQRFNKENLEEGLKSKIETLSINISEYRENNFIGQLFMHQSMQSTKYMSKWIEAKNG